MTNSAKASPFLPVAAAARVTDRPSLPAASTPMQQTFAKPHPAPAFALLSRDGAGAHPPL